MTDSVFSLQKALALLRAAAALIIVLTLCVGSASAHKVKVFAYLEGDKIIVEGYFGGKSKAENCVVSIRNAAGKELLSGKTDKQGMASFALKDLGAASGDLKIVLEAGEGHLAEYTLKAEELPKNAKSADSPTVEAPKKKDAEAGSSPTMAASQTGAVDTSRLEKMIEAAVHKETAPLIKMIGNQQRLLLEMQDHGPSLERIIGGIGWILGLVGVVAYMLSRKSRSDA